MRVLHISDLHATPREDRDQRKLAKAMIADAARRNDETPIDVVVFSGDLAKYGKPEDFELASEILLTPLEEALSLPRDRFVLVPGNHDVDRDDIDEFTERGLLDLLVDRSTLEALLAAPDKLASATARLRAWDVFRATYYAGVTGITSHGPLAFVHTIALPNISLGVVALNSAWRSSSNADRGNLLLGELQLAPSLDAVQSLDLSLVVVHHPLDWLARYDADTVRTELEGRGAFVLSGHEHRPDPSSTTSARGGMLQSRAGCLYETHDYANSFSIIDVLPRESPVDIWVREWYPQRSPEGAFGPATSLAEHGLVKLTKGDPGTRTHPPYSVVMSSLTKMVRDRSVVADASEEAINDEIDALLVAPRLSAVPYTESRVAQKLGGDQAEITDPDPLEALTARRVVIVCGENHEDGVTSSLLWLLARQYEASDRFLPIYVSSPARFGTRRGAALIDTAAAEIGKERASAGLPDMVMAVDDAGDPRPRRLARLSKYVAENPRHAYILGCHGDQHAGLVAALADRGVEAVRLFVWPFATGQLRQLVVRVDGQDDDALVRRISGVIRSNQLPRSPFIMTALIAVLREHGDPGTLNESSVLAAYANFLLGSEEIGDIEGLDQDFRRREYLLGRLAKELLGHPGYRITRYEAEQFVTNFFAEQSYTRSPTAVLQSFIDRRVLAEADDYVSFRHNALLYLFAGRHMNESDQREFRAAMVTDSLRFAPVIRHAAGLDRNDPALLEVIGTQLGSALSAVTNIVDTESFDRMLGSEEANEASLELLRQQLIAIAPEKPSDEDRDRMNELSEREEDDEEDEPEDLDPVQELGERLDLLMAVLRSSEFVTDIELKGRLVAVAIEAQGILGAVTAAAEEQDHALRDLLGHALDAQRVALAISQDMIEHQIRRFFASLLLVATLGGLGAPSLGSAVERVTADSEFMASPTRGLLATMLACLLNRRQWGQGMIGLYERFPEHPFLKEMLRDFMTQLYKNSSDRQTTSVLEPFLTDLYAAGSDPRTPVRSQVQQQLRLARGRAQSEADGGDVLDEIQGDEVIGASSAASEASVVPPSAG